MFSTGFEEPSKLGSLGRGLSSVERDTDLLMAVLSGHGTPFEFSMEMTSIIGSFDTDTLRSRSLVIDRRTEPKAPKELRGGLGETERAGGMAFLLGPKGKRERSERKEGTEFAGEACVDGE